MYRVLVCVALLSSGCVDAETGGSLPSSAGSGSEVGGSGAGMSGAPALPLAGSAATNLGGAAGTGGGSSEVAGSGAAGAPPSNAGSGGTGGSAPTSLVPDPAAGGWQLNEYSQIVDGALELTPGRADTDGHERGTAFWPTALASEGLHIEFDADITPKQDHGDGMTLALADVAAGAKVTDFGDSGGGLGYSSAPCCVGIKGLAVALDTSKNANDPGPNFLGVATGGSIDKLTWAATETEGVPAWVGAVHRVSVTISGGTLLIAVDGAEVLHTSAGSPAVPAQIYLGFTGANGSGKSRQLVKNLVVSRP